MEEKECRAVQGPPPTVCSLCGKAFGFWDAVQDFTLDEFAAVMYRRGLLDE